MWTWRNEGNFFQELSKDDQRALLDRFIPMQTRPIRDFLNYDTSGSGKSWSRHSDKTVLVGPKGAGKTLLLSMKAVIDRWRKEGDEQTVFYPRDKPMVEPITRSREIQEHAYANSSHWKQAESWGDAWLYTLMIVVFEISGNFEELSRDQQIEYLTYFNRLYRENTQGTLLKMESCVSYLRQVMHLTNSHDKKAFFRFMERVIEPHLKADQNKTYNIYLDTPDEAFADLGTHEHSSHRHGVAHLPSPKGEPRHTDSHFWLELQTGLLLAVRNIRQYSKLIRVYTSVKTEIYGLDTRGVLFQQATGISQRLHYDRVLLRKIFSQNWKESMPQIPMPPVPHPVVTDGEGNPIKEDAIDYVLRHTFYNPRSLMDIGGRIYDHVESVDELTGEQLRSIVKEAEVELFNAHRDQTKSWDDRLLQVLNFISSNVVSRSAADYAKECFSKWVDDNAANDLRGICPFQYLYSNGMVGISGDGNIQHFRTKWTDSVNVYDPIADSDYFFIHPLLFHRFKQQQAQSLIRFSHSGKTISGEGLPYHPEPTIKVLCRKPYRPAIIVNDSRQLGLRPNTAPCNLLLSILHAATIEQHELLAVEEIENSVSALVAERVIRPKNQVLLHLEDFRKAPTNEINKAFRALLGHSPLGFDNKLEQITLIGFDFEHIEFVSDDMDGNKISVVAP